MTAETLRPLWRGFERVVFNGDTAELQMPWLRAAAEREVWRLREWTAADGVEMTLLCGNHDAHISDRQHLTLMDGRVLVMHGHAIHPAVAPWTRVAKAMAQMTRAGFADMPAQRLGCIDHRLALAQSVACEGFGLDPLTRKPQGPRPMDILVKPCHVAKVLRFWWAAPRLAAEFAQQYCPQAQAVVVGHSHRQGIWRRGGRTVLNTGSFGFPGRPRAIVAEGTTLEVVDVLQKGVACVLSKRARFRLELPDALPRRREVPARAA